MRVRTTKVRIKGDELYPRRGGWMGLAVVFTTLMFGLIVCWLVSH